MYIFINKKTASLIDAGHLPSPDLQQGSRLVDSSPKRSMVPRRPIVHGLHMGHWYRNRFTGALHQVHRSALAYLDAHILPELSVLCHRASSILNEWG